MGNIGFVGDIATVSIELGLGYVMDHVGRKILSVVGISVTVGALVGSPNATKIYWLYIFRTIMNLGVLPILHSPYQIDYIEKESMGKFQALMAIVT